MKEHLFRKAVTRTAMGLTLAIFGCSLEHAPLIRQAKLGNLTLSFQSNSLSQRLIDSLLPVEKTTLTDGLVSQISVHMSASGTGSYFVQLWANGKKFHPCKVSVLQTPLSQAVFSGTISWFVKVGRKNEHVIVRLYQVELSNTGQTKVTTLVQEIQRDFNVVCNKKAFFIIRFFKEQILCSCTPDNPQ